jgi:ATP-dependent Clp protease ATP-binding subunit ClpC
LELAGTSFSSRARQAFSLAQEAAIRSSHEYFGAQHILLGVLGTSKGAASAALDAIGVDRAEVRSRAEAMFPPGSAPAGRGELPYDQSAIRLVQKAIEEARTSNNGLVSTGHLLLAGLADRTGPITPILQAAGVNIEELEVTARTHLAGGDTSE